MPWSSTVWLTALLALAEPMEPHMTLLNVTVGRSTLLDAQRTLGPTDLRHNAGDAAASASVECYIGKDGTTLVLSSNSEMGGGTTITHLQIVERTALADYSEGIGYVVPPNSRPRCATLKALSRSTATAGGLRLGMGAENVRRLLGTPVESSAHRVMFKTRSQSSTATGERVRIIEVMFEKDKATEIHLYKADWD
jgi:hypothetical protein